MKDISFTRMSSMAMRSLAKKNFMMGGDENMFLKESELRRIHINTPKKSEKIRQKTLMRNGTKL